MWFNFLKKIFYRKSKSKVESTISETFELDKEGNIKFKDGFDSFGILVSGDGTKISRTKEKEEKE